MCTASSKSTVHVFDVHCCHSILFLMHHNAMQVKELLGVELRISS